MKQNKEIWIKTKKLQEGYFYLYQVLSSTDTVNQAIQGGSGTQAFVVTPVEKFHSGGKLLFPKGPFQEI